MSSELDHYEKMMNKVLFGQTYDGPKIRDALKTQEANKWKSFKQPTESRVRKAKPYPFPQWPKPEEPKRSAQMARSYANAEALAKKESAPQEYKGPFVGGYSAERKFLFKVSNNAHNASTNNGYARKQSGGFYFH